MEEINRVKNCISEIKKEVLPLQDIDINIWSYTTVHMHLAQMYFFLNEFKQSFYHLCECHGTLLRRYTVLEELRKQECFGMQNMTSILNWEYLSTTSRHAKEEDLGLFKRLSEMPSEWTIVQLSRIQGDKEHLISQDCYPKLERMFISRMQCGASPDEILVEYTDLPNLKEDILNQLKEATEKLLLKGSSKRVFLSRKKGSDMIEGVSRNLEQDLFMDWKCLLLGKLQDGTLEKKVRSTIDRFLEEHCVELSPRIKALFYLIAEGVHFYEPIIVKSSIYKNLSSYEQQVKNKFLTEIMNLKDLLPELLTARRHPVILIVEDALDIVPWESVDILKEQAATRVPSVHFLYALFKAHENNIVQGLREIGEGKLNCYILNPDLDLSYSEKRLKPFFEARLPGWQGIVGEKPTTCRMFQLLSSSNTYLYCGHGSSGHLLSSDDVKKLNLKNSIQIVFGCRSAALSFLGGSNPMMGHMLHYCIAGSPCSVGMLYSVMSGDTDDMTTAFSNIWLPGTPIHSETLKPLIKKDLREAELLRVLPKVRSLVKLRSNGLAFISRGLPVKLVPST